MQSFFIYESNGKFEMYNYCMYKWIDIVKAAKVNKIICLLTVAFSILTFFVFEGLSIFPEWLKGFAILFEILGAVFLVPKILASDNILVKDKDLEPQNILASRELYFLKYCGCLADPISPFNIYYIQWEDGKGIIIDSNNPIFHRSERLVPDSALEKGKESTLLVKKNEIKREFSADIVNSESILDVVRESRIIDDMVAGAIKKEKTGKKILEKILKEC